MSDMFESLDLNMREEADRVNPTKAIMASQMECEQRFENFVAKNPERIDFLSDDIRSVADKYAAEYNIPSETIYEATVTHLKEAAVRKNSYEDLFDDGQSRIINDFVGSNMVDLDQIEMYFDQYKPEIESTLRSPYDEERHQQLRGELEHLKEELQGIGGGEEGSERYWNLEEQIVDALNSLNDHEQRQTFSSVEKEAEWDKPWTEEDESKEESEEHEESESEEEEEEEEEKKESSVREAGFEDETSIVKELLMGGKDYESDDPNHSLGMSMMTGGQFGGHPYNVVLGMIANHMFKDINDFIHWMDENVVGNYNKRVLESGETQQVIDESKVDWQSIWSMLVHDVQEYWADAKERYNASKEEREGDSIYGGGEPEWYDKYHDWKVSSVKTAEVNLVPPEGVRGAAKRGIKYHAEGKAGDGFESATLARAKRIAAGEELTPEHVKRMHSFFERHAGGRSQKAKQGEITPWDVAWLAWGGDSGRSWAARKVEELERSEKTSAKNCNCWDGYKRVPGTKPCTPGSCEKCDAHRKKEAAIEEFINLHEAALIPDWMRPEKGMTWRDLLQRSNRQKFERGKQRADSVSEMTSPQNDGVNYSDEQPTIELPSAQQKGYYVPGDDKTNEGYGYASGADFADLEQQEADKARVERLQGQDITKTPDYAKKRQPKQRAYNQYEQDIRATGSLKEDLVDFYVSQGMPDKTAAILVEAMGEMAQLHEKAKGLPVDANDPDQVNPDKAIGGKEGDKYQNWDVEDKQKELGLEHQDFTDFGEPVREFVQPGGEAPYSENTKKRIDDAEQDNLNAKGVKQDDNAPKKSSASVKEADNNRAAIDELIEYARRGMRALREASKIDEKDGFSWDNAKWNQEEENLKQEILLLAEDMVNQPLSSLRDLEHYIPGAYGEIESFLSSSMGYQMSPEELTQMAENDPDEFIDRFASMDSSEAQIEELMKQGMTPEQAIQSLDVYNKDIPKGWGGSKTRAT